jgi:hypothetical protein
VPDQLPPFTAYGLPLEPRRRGPAAALSLLVHGAIALLVLWRGAALMAGGGGSGPLGGGGGGGRPAVTWFTLRAASTPQMHEVPAVPAVTVPDVAFPDPVRIEVPQLQPAAPSVAVAASASAGAGTSGGPGEGAGTGTGAGTDSGPGSGGAGSYIPLAEPVGVILWPACARGEFKIRVRVEADGRVSRVEVDPLPKDAGCRRQVIETLRAYRFKPAKAQDGRPVASIFPFTYTH